MNERSNRLFGTALFAILLLLGLGCTQSDNVAAPVASTQISINPQRLPAPPEGYAYALWVEPVEGDPIFIDIFDWNSELYKFTDTTDVENNQIEPVWTLNIDVLHSSYAYLSLTIEKLDEFTDTTEMGPVMLQSDIHDPEEEPIKMVFPYNLWDGTGSFCVETPTDKNSNSNDDGGIWFAIYVYDSVLVNDTLGFLVSTLQFEDRELEIDTTYWVCNEYSGPDCIDSTEVTSADPYDWRIVDTLNLEELANTLDTIGYRNLDTTLIGNVFVSILDTLTDGLGNDSIVALDTLAYEYIRYDVVATPVNVGTTNRIDTVRLIITPSGTTAVTATIPPFTDVKWFFSYGLRARTVFIDRFTDAFDDLPDLQGTDWHYKGWVISPYIDTVTFGKLSKPVWLPVQYEVFLSPSTGGMISTGSFKSFYLPDDENPYSMKGRVPPYPGEDFLQNLPGGHPPLTLCDAAHPAVAGGTVFITVEPDNFESDTTNFPLILMTGGIPSYQNVSNQEWHSQIFDLINRFQALNDDPHGWPALLVTIDRK
ncbi:MAG: hypothetical protein JW763_04620 [candidate division Zixibacteria bacterium]|nr:hypothetical protein [candidate division Zixibacteria bacterium]